VSAARRLALLALLAALLAPARAAAQEADDGDRRELWPEVDVWVRLAPAWQLFLPFALSRAREVDYTEGLVGVHVDHRASRHLSVRAGYRYLWALDEPEGPDRYREHRVVAEATPRLALPGGVLLLDRNRVDLRSIAGEASWRYRNRVRAERTVPTSAHGALTPYAMVEVGWDSRYDEFNRTRLSLGVESQFSRTLMLDTYLVRQWDDRAAVPRLWAIGLALNVTLRTRGAE
jgi:hypothetical protein